ncbi:MAG: hydroxymethylglutaryl-CoA reductase, partial [Saprospiraceae bacterium]|nr:hydroxymethylglutaryl-CoA reductase [Saprospiraceae bacterium]
MAASKTQIKGLSFSIKNRLSDATLSGILSISINGQEVSLQDVSIDLFDRVLRPAEITTQNPVDFPLRKTFNVLVKTAALPEGKHSLEIGFEVSPFGKLTLQVDDSIKKEDHNRIKIPRDDNDDYSPEAIKTRQKFVEEFAGVKP